MNSFQLHPIAALPGGTPGITYIVSTKGVVYYTREYIRHSSLLSRSGETRENIAWGGILTSEGEWVRRSFDFGDAPNPDVRDLVVAMIKARLR